MKTRIQTNIALFIFLFFLCSCSLETTGACIMPDKNTSLAYPNVISNNYVVLIKENNKYGALVFLEQRENPVQAKYVWYYRDDGKSLLNPKDPKVKTGTSTTPAGASMELMRPIEFGSFIIDWSYGAIGAGYLYYKERKNTLIEIAVTDKTSVSGIDASSIQWNYTSKPSLYQQNTCKGVL